MSAKIENKQLLLPVNPLFMAASLVLALLLNFIPLGRLAWRPDILAVVLVFWCVHQPKRLHFSVAFLLGLAMDVHQGVLLGQHALSYVLLGLIAAVGARRILWFDLRGQMMHVLPLFILLHAMSVALHWLRGGESGSWWVLMAPLIETLLWPLANLVLLWPQRRMPEKDKKL